MRPLAFLTRHAPIVLASDIFLGIAWPGLARTAAPLLVPAVVILLTAALVRMDWAQVAALRRRPFLVLLLFLWMLGVSPLLMAGLAAALPLPSPLESAIVLSAACPPIMSSIAFALIFGLDAALMVVVVFGTVLLVPLTLPPIALLLLGIELGVDLFAFMGRLAAITAGSILFAGAIRAVVPKARIDANAESIDGVAVVMLLVFAVAIMNGVTAALVERTGYVFLTLGAAFVVNLILQLCAGSAFFWVGRWQAVSIALASGNRNMGLLLAALAGAAEFDLVLFFALGQIPIYVLPAALRPIYRRVASSSSPRRDGPSISS